MTGDRKRILISGAGIAGPALAWWLLRFGFEPTIVEIAPRFRSGGYIIDFWGKGFDLVEEMGLLPEVERAGYHVREVRFVNSDGSRAGGFSTDPFFQATDGRFTSIPRGSLAKIIWESVRDRIDCRFGDEVAAIEQGGGGVAVEFANSPGANFDLVIGADGLHSRVRELVFGPEGQFEHFLGYRLAALTVDGYEPRVPDSYMTYGVAARQASRFAMREGKTMILFIWREQDSRLPQSEAERRALIRQRFGGLGWEVPRMLESLDSADDLYLDNVSQIRMAAWSNDRVGLTGDAAWAPSFLAGEGCGLAIIGSYVLAGELARASGEPAAFAVYEKRLRSFIGDKQKMAARFGGAFVPKTTLGIIVRNWASSLLNVGPVAKLALSSGLSDDIELPDYSA
ncbi:MAG TPA: FAD-binding domain [Sphingomicrobium sp.]|nr:FAD-binding domain [Sphingomicrobium sp.]